MKKINRVFDIIGPRGNVPNGWNYNYTEDFWNHNFIVNHLFIQDFNKNYEQIPVFDCNLNISEDYVKNFHIGELQYDSSTNKVKFNNNSDLNFFYTIHPFGSIDTCLGKNLNYHQNHNCFDFISYKAKFLLKNATNFYLIFDYSSEGDIRKEMFEVLHKKCEEYNLPYNKILVITSSMNTRDIYQSYLQDKNIKNEFYTAYYNWAVINKRGETNTIINDNSIYEFNGNRNVNTLMTEDECDKSTQRKFKALCLNRRIAPHRLITLSLAESNGILDSINYSIDFDMYYDKNFIGQDLISGKSYDQLPYIDNQEIKNKMIDGLFRLIKKGNRTVDYKNINKVWGFGFEKKDIYIESYFSIITETLFYEHGHYISEKTFKGIQHLHPFVIVGKPGIIKYLKNLGFQTFSDFWDETYDEINNDSDRMIVISNLIKELCEKSKDEWDLLYKKMKPILIHNRNHLLSFDEYKVSQTYMNNLFKLIQNEPNKENYYLL